MQLKVCFCYVLIVLSIFAFKINCYEEKNGTMRVDLYRKPSARHQYLMHAPTLKEYGTNYDKWLGDRYNYRMNRTNDSIALYRYLDNEFYGVIVGGSPGQTFNVAFDTAWSVSWVMSKQCTKVPTPGCENHNLYDHGRSSSWKKNGTPYIANEGDFNFTGFYSYDIFKIAHSNITNYLFVEMVGVPDFMSLHKSDGIFGLGIKNDDYEPFFYAMYRQKKIRDPIFSIYLNRDRQSKRGGNVLLGFIDDKHIHKTQLKNGTVVPDEIKYLPVTSNQFWQFAVDKIVVVPDHPPHNENVTLCPNGCSAISNTGSNEIVGPPADIDQIHDLIDAQLYNGSWVVNCNTVNKLPKIDFVLGGQYFRLGGPNYIIKISSGPYTMCVSAFSSYQTDKDMWILGGAFLSQYYSIYNIEDKTIGFVRVP
ncbi:lysosomal aspartic protease [Leptinotarsa decemlineata]|uniref:lysosomal aspartic protease n=1 Tax=Leptinotarsa decemlineata TaxID=7539 RepID=UPI003D307D60